MSNNLNIRSQKTLRELEEALSNLNIPILVFKDLLKAIKNNDFSNLSGSVNKLRYMTSEEKVKEQIDNVIYQQVYNSNDYNNLIILITKIYSIIDSLVEARMNITDVYKQDIEVVENMLDSYGFDIHKIFDENSKRDLAHRIYYFLRRKGTPDLIGEFLNKLGYTHYAINEYSLNRENTEWKLIPENIKLSDAAQDWKDELFFNNINLNEIDDAFWYLDEDTLNNIFFKNTRLYPKYWNGKYESKYMDTLFNYLGLPMNVDEISYPYYAIHDINCVGDKLMIMFSCWYIYKYREETFIVPEGFPNTFDILDGFGNVLETREIDTASQRTTIDTRTYLAVINTQTNEVEKNYVLYDGQWRSYFFGENAPTWNVETAYKEGFPVKYNGTVYMCLEDHISGEEFDSSYWTTYILENFTNWWFQSGMLPLEMVKDKFKWLFSGYIDTTAVHLVDDRYIFLQSDYGGYYLVLDLEEDYKIDIIHIPTPINIITGEMEDISLYNDKYTFSFIGNWLVRVGSYDDFVFINRNTNTYFDINYDFLFYSNNYGGLEYRHRGRYFYEYKNYLYFPCWYKDEPCIMWLHIDDIETHVINVNNLLTQEEKHEYVENIISKSHMIIPPGAEALDGWRYFSFFIGRDGIIYISSAQDEDNISMDLKDWYCYDSIVQVKSYDHQGNLLNTIMTGSLSQILGVDSKGQLILLSFGGYYHYEICYFDSVNKYSVTSPHIHILSPVINPNEQQKNYNELKMLYEKLNPQSYYLSYNRLYLESDILNAPSNKTGSTSVIYNNKMYIFGGNRITEETVDMWIFDLDSREWKFNRQHPIESWFFKIQYASSNIINNKMYIFGGNYNTYDKIYVFDFNTKKWSYTLDMPYYVYYHTTNLINEKIYLISYSFNLEWDYKNNIWVEKTLCPQKRERHSSFVLNNKIYVVGGVKSNLTSYSYRLKDVWMYDPSTDIWTQKNDFVTPIFGHTSTTLDGIPYLVENGNLWRYNEDTDSWSQLASLPRTDTSYTTLISYNHKLYIFVKDTVYYYLPDADIWEEILTGPPQ